MIQQCVLRFLLIASCYCSIYWGFRFNRRISSLVSIRSRDNPEFVRLSPVKEIHGPIVVPGSKSITNRAFLLSALSNGVTRLEDVLLSDDTNMMIKALISLGIKVEAADGSRRTWIVHGNNGAFQTSDEKLTQLDLGNAGTVMRPLAAILCAGKGYYRLDGSPRMRERPIQELVNALQSLGCDISCSTNGCPPVEINAKPLCGGHVTLAANLSSQYVSALLMTAPLACNDMRIELSDAPIISHPYIDMTISMMRSFGVKVDTSAQTISSNKSSQTSPTIPSSSWLSMRPIFSIPAHQMYQSPSHYSIEGDATSASYFLAAAVILGDQLVDIVGLSRNPQASLQGDMRFIEILKRMGAEIFFDYDDMTGLSSSAMKPSSLQIIRHSNQPLVGIDEDCRDIPDVAMTLAVLGLLAKGKTLIRNVYSWRVKECERMEALVTELSKFGAKIQTTRDSLEIEGISDWSRLPDDVWIDTYDDHRMAMCFSLIACAGKSVRIANPKCVEKTFPEYFSLWKQTMR